MLQDLKILIVEDDKQTQENYAFIFNNFIKVKKLYQAYSAEEGLKLYKEIEPDIIISDITLPNMNGLEMSQKIREKDKNIPIILISAYDNKEYFLQAINELKADYYLIKPIKIEELLNKLKFLKEKIIQTQEIFKDHLTSVYNRKFFDKKMEELISSKENFTLFFIDIDNFKKINDTYGHLIGDEVLKIFVKRIKDVIKEEDILARLGGDEFALIIKNINEETSKKIAKRILSSLGSFKIENLTIPISCSIGIKQYKNQNKKEFLTSTDKALYKAKKGGKNRFYYL